MRLGLYNISGNLRDANLSKANLTNAVLTKFDLSGADLAGAKGTSGTQLGETKSLQGVIMPDGSKHL
jgi:uncharacterized protein YjbI with pentapeptide repeats